MVTIVLNRSILRIQRMAAAPASQVPRRSTSSNSSYNLQKVTRDTSGTEGNRSTFFSTSSVGHEPQACWCGSGCTSPEYCAPPEPLPSLELDPERFVSGHERDDSRPSLTRLRSSAGLLKGMHGRDKNTRMETDRVRRGDSFFEDDVVGRHPRTF